MLLKYTWSIFHSSKILLGGDRDTPLTVILASQLDQGKLDAECIIYFWFSANYVEEEKASLFSVIKMERWSSSPVQEGDERRMWTWRITYKQHDLFKPCHLDRCRKEKNIQLKEITFPTITFVSYFFPMFFFWMELVFSSGTSRDLHLAMQHLVINPAFRRKHVGNKKLCMFMALQREFPCLENTAF